MSVGGVLARGRRRHNILFRDKIVVTRGAVQVTDPITGVVSVSSVTIYTGKADVKLPATLREKKAIAGEERVEVGRYDVGVPFDTVADFRALDVVTVTESDDPHMAGRTLVVASTAYSGRRTARHLACEDYQGGGG